MNSAGHKANILTCSNKALGVGVGRAAATYGIYWTQDFGTPLSRPRRRAAVGRVRACSGPPTRPAPDRQRCGAGAGEARLMEVLGGSLGAAALMALAALIIGYSKTALGGLAVISVAIFATVLPAKQSTAAILAVLIVGDVIACWHYRHDADWSLIRRLLPAVVPGWWSARSSCAASTTPPCAAPSAACCSCWCCCSCG